ncbi:MAG: tyrosine-type recombinase/integrase [Candidatus Omnitrophota bacterium]
MFGLKYKERRGKPGRPTVDETEKSPERWEVEKFLAEVKKDWRYDRIRRLYYCFWIMANLGLRISEARDVRYNDIAEKLQIKAMTIRTRKKKPKPGHPPGPKLMGIFISTEEAGALYQMLKTIRPAKDGRFFPYCQRLVQYYFDFYRERARLRKSFIPHSMRHFASGNLMQHCNGRYEIVMKRLRHEKPQHPTFTYIEPSKQAQMDALEQKRCVY